MCDPLMSNQSDGYVCILCKRGCRSMIPALRKHHKETEATQHKPAELRVLLDEGTNQTHSTSLAILARQHAFQHRGNRLQEP